MASRKQYKHRLLFLLLSGISYTHAGWLDITTHVARYAWLAPIVSYTYQARQASAQTATLVHKRFNSSLATRYPEAHAYVKDELTAAGINPAIITILDECTRKSSYAYAHAHAIEVPVHRLEQVLHAIQLPHSPAGERRLAYRLAKIKFTIAHEIGHLIQYKQFYHRGTSLTWAAAGVGIVTGLLSRSIPQPCTPVRAIAQALAGAVTKFWLAHAISSVHDWFKEYDADTAFITRFKDNPDILHHVAQRYLSRHCKELYACAAWASNKDEFLAINDPMLLTLQNIKNHEKHPTDLARAARFFTAAGHPTSQQQLAADLCKQARFIQTPLGNRLYELTNWHRSEYRALRKNQLHENIIAWLTDCAKNIQEIPKEQTQQACLLLKPFIQRLPEYELSFELERLRTLILQNYQSKCQQT